MNRKNIILLKSRFCLLDSSPNGSLGDYDHEEYWLLDNKIKIHTRSNTSIKTHTFIIIDNESKSVTWSIFNIIYLLPNYINYIYKTQSKFIIPIHNIEVNIIQDFPDFINMSECLSRHRDKQINKILT